jgi:hypothetical protein
MPVHGDCEASSSGSTVVLNIICGLFLQRLQNLSEIILIEGQTLMNSTLTVKIHNKHARDVLT